MSSTRKCIIPGCDHLQNSSVSLLNKLLEEDRRETAALPGVGVASAPPVDMPPAFESREYGLFFQDFDSLFYLFGTKIIAFKFGWVVNNTFFCGVTNSEHTFNIDFTWTLSFSNSSDRICITQNIGNTPQKIPMDK